MINLRYHIVSITAVFLALGIGLTLGSTFLDRVTVDTLKNQLDTVQARVDETEAESSRLRDRLAALDDREAELIEELPERLVDAHLEEVPVLVVVAAGTPERLVDAALTTLAGAGAQTVGSWELTERWSLDDDEDVRDLSALLGVRTDDADRLRRNGAIRLADALVEAIEPDPAGEDLGGDEAEVGGEGTEGPPPTGGTEDPATVDQEDEDASDPSTDPEPPAPTEPDIAASLEGAGFLDYGAVRGGGERILLPAEGLRVLVISNVEPTAGTQAIAIALLDELTAEGPVPVVAAQGEVELTDEDGDPEPEGSRRTSFVGPIRSGELTRDRMSTIDALDTAAGLAGLVLALDDAGDLRLGHYGVAPGAARLLPGTEPST